MLFYQIPHFLRDVEDNRKKRKLTFSSSISKNKHELQQICFNFKTLTS